MKLAALAFALAFAGATHAQAQSQPPADQQPQQGTQQQNQTRPSGPLQQKLVPGMARYTDEVLFGEIWPGEGLSPRDRSLAVISVLIATNKPAQLRGHLGRALTNGVTPMEASGVLTHLAIYSGWPNAVSALQVYDEVYTERDVDFAALQAELEPLSSSSESDQTSNAQLEAVAPKFADLTDRIVHGDLWSRSDLSVRDRSLVTIATLTGTGDIDLIEPYLRRGIEAGLTRDEIAEALTHLAFYAGWGKATRALTVVSETLGD
jgi:Uncharacterized homolog of gamma-carboxymuconolactone decarboxylase subunit